MRKTVGCLFFVIHAAVCPSGLHAEPLGLLRESFLDIKFGMFFHYKWSTCDEKEWIDPGRAPASFKRVKLDCGHWAEAARSRGMKYVVITTKRHDGLCLWESKTTTYYVAVTPLKDRDFFRKNYEALSRRDIQPCGISTQSRNPWRD